MILSSSNITVFAPSSVFTLLREMFGARHVPAFNNATKLGLLKEDGDNKKKKVSKGKLTQSNVLHEQ